GPSSYLGSLSYALKHALRLQPAILEGYLKYGGRPFRIPTVSGWQIILSSPELLKEVGRTSEDVLSFAEWANSSFQTKYTLAHGPHNTQPHIPVIQNRLTRNLVRLFPDIRDEVVAAFDETLMLHNNEWKAIPAHRMALNVSARTINRIFVGLPYCRNPEYVDLCIRFTTDVAKAAIVLKVTPKILRPIVAQYFTKANKNIEHMHTLLGPMITERLRLEAELGDEWMEKPNDLLSWLMDEVPAAERTPYELGRLILIINFAAIHTLSQALFNLATYPIYVSQLREEVTRVVNAEGWSKTALGKMVRLESFLAETMRVDGMFLLSMQRKAMRDVTLSDGTFIPKGAYPAVATHVRHVNTAIYGEDAETFNPWRFLTTKDGVIDSLGDNEDEDTEDQRTVRNKAVTPSEDWLVFGYGRHACPGRFFVVNELKAMLAHVLLSYDIKLTDDAQGNRPANLEFGHNRVANQRAKVMIRRRAD
ncbi:cytochrome P450, partial [Coniophora puteana RWD-64-598 SS2]